MALQVRHANARRHAPAQAYHPAPQCAARRAPDDPEAVGALALAYHADGFADQALATYGRAEAIAPEDPRWPYGAALLLAERGESAAAAGALERVLARDPAHALASYRLGEDLSPGKFGVFYKVQRPTKNANEAAIIADYQSKVAGLAPWQILKKNFDRMK